MAEVKAYFEQLKQESGGRITMERHQEILNRINELARTAKERDLTPAELVERE